MSSIDQIIDKYRLTPLGWLNQVDIQMMAVCGDGIAVGEDIGFLIVVRRGDADALLCANSRLERKWDFELSEIETVAVRRFVALHQDALVRHWNGRIDSIELVEHIQKRAD